MIAHMLPSRYVVCVLDAVLATLSTWTTFTTFTTFTALVILTTLTPCVVCQYPAEFRLSSVARELGTNATRIYTSVRSGDPSTIVPHLYQGDAVYLQMCTDDWINVSFTNVTFSNDGSADRVTLSVDGLYVGEFETIAHSDWGALWNTFYGSGYIGHSGQIPPGEHRVEIRVASSDCYGVELGTVYIQADKPVNSDLLWCGQGFEFAPTKPDCTAPGNTQFQVTSPPSTTPALPHRYVHVGQYSFRSDCLDTKNVRISFRSRDLVGTTISASHDTPLASRVSAETPKSSGARFCKNRIWQLGRIDGDNKEFAPIFSGETITINMTGLTNQEAMFPAKIMPFATTKIVINFQLPDGVSTEGSAFFALGLVNLTKKAEIGLQFLDHPRQAFSDIHYITFTPDWHVMGWNIPDLGRILHKNNTFILHFISDSNLIMFDFLKLEYYHRDERKLNLPLYQSGRWKLRGLRYRNSMGVGVFVDSVRARYAVEELVILYKIYPFRHYQNVLRIHADGHVFLYRPYYVNLAEQEKVFVDVSGFLFTTSGVGTVTFTHPLAALHINTSADTIALHYQDGAVVHLKLMADLSHTKVQIVNFNPPPRNQSNVTSLEPTVIFTSTHVTDYLAAINEISMDEGVGRGVLEDLTDYSGGSAYTLRRSSPNNMYYSNNVFKIEFPK